MIFMIQII